MIRYVFYPFAMYYEKSYTANFVMWKIRGMQKFLRILKTDLLNGWETYRVKKMIYQCQSH